MTIWRSGVRRLLVCLLSALTLLGSSGTAGALPPFPPSDPTLPRLRVVPCAPLVLVHQRCPMSVLGPPGARFTLFQTDPDARGGWGEHGFIPTVLDARGRADFATIFSNSMLLYASVPGGPPSEVVTVHVKRRVTLEVTRIARGQYRFTGENDPAQTPLAVTLARVLPDGRLVGVAPARLRDSDFSYAVDVRLSPGTWFFTVLTGPTNRFLVQGNSRIYGLVVPPG
jgi:hypothetical protein